MPILWWFHGSGGNAAHCGSSALVSLAESTGFAFICGEATQNVFGHGGQWNIPAKITDATGTPCSSSDSVEVNYMKNALAELAKSPETYDTTRVFTSGCSMGSAFSGYIGNCLKQWEPQQISAFATHSTGLKVKGDGNHLPEDWGECDGCQYWPFAPVKYTDKVGLKACVFDNTGDGDFYKTSEYLAQEWQKLGNPTESYFASGGHCQNIPYTDIVKCLGISGSSRKASEIARVSITATMNTSNTPTCSVNGVAGGQVVTFSDGTYQRCMSLITPSSAPKPMPILWWFHGSGGNAAHCGGMTELISLANSHGFALVCGEATQNVFGHGGQWNIPAKITDQTGTPCSDTDSVEVNYMKNALAHLAKSPGVYDTSRVFTSGCSMGSAFSGYIGNCLKQWDASQISAFATHSTGLKKKGDGVRLPENWGE